MTPESLQELQRILLTKQPRGAVGSTTPDVGSITPLSPYEALQAERSQLSSDPVIANLQKFGRGVKGLFEPETPMDYLSMVIPTTKLLKGAEVTKKTIKNSKKSKPLHEKMSPGELDASERFLQYHLLKPYKGSGPKTDTYEILEDRIVVYWGAGDKMFPNKVSQKTYKNPTLKNLQKDFGY